MGEAIVLRRAWDISREHAREAARAARIPGEGWVPAGAFDKWRGQAARRRKGCGAGAAVVDGALAERGTRPATGGDGPGRGVSTQADPVWTRHVCCAMRRAGYVRAKVEHENKERLDAAAGRRKRAREEVRVLRAGLQH
jgi:hypothetical protein